jgi:hypothetical protein
LAQQHRRHLFPPFPLTDKRAPPGPPLSSPFLLPAVEQRLHDPVCAQEPSTRRAQEPRPRRPAPRRPARPAPVATKRAGPMLHRTSAKDPCPRHAHQPPRASRAVLRPRPRPDPRHQAERPYPPAPRPRATPRSAPSPDVSARERREAQAERPPEATATRPRPRPAGPETEAATTIHSSPHVNGDSLRPFLLPIKPLPTSSSLMPTLLMEPPIVHFLPSASLSPRPLYKTAGSLLSPYQNALPLSRFLSLPCSSFAIAPEPVSAAPRHSQQRHAPAARSPPLLSPCPLRSSIVHHPWSLTGTHAPPSERIARVMSSVVDVTAQHDDHARSLPDRPLPARRRSPLHMSESKVQDNPNPLIYCLNYVLN